MPPDTTSFRSIRVFVSSTFRDMQEEREELVKQVFPLLRRLCESRGVAWSEVDLRWGVTDEQKAEGAVLPICLAEIDRSRPYFIGLLGQRYGWIPEALPEGLADQLPWLAELDGTSVTEMEILHGVLNDPAAAEHAYFYTRDPAWVDARPAQDRLVLGEVESDDEVAVLGVDAAAAAAAARRERLEELKARIRTAGLSTWQYPDPRQLGERVLADFTALVDRLFPEHDVPDAHARDDEAHRAYGHAQTLGQIERPAIQARLDAFANGVEPPLVLSGEAGSGVSSIVSAWLEGWRAAHPADTVVEHHVGATSDASEWTSLADRTIATLNAGTNLATDAPADSAARRAALFAAIAAAGARPGRTVIVVDGADLLTDVDGARSLTWLPSVVPPSVRVIVTTNRDDAADPTIVEAHRRGWPVATVPPLDEAERRALIRSFLGRYAKGLDEVHVVRLVGAPMTGNVLYLRTLLDELRQHGDHFTLGDVIERYLAAPTLDALLGLVLARYERDFERDRPGLVRDAMRSLWAARRGLTEPELLDIVGAPGRPETQAVWAPLSLAAEAGLVMGNGLLRFATEPHRRAAEQRYLATDDAQREAHAYLGAMFARSPLGPRVVEELPWQQLGAGDLDALFTTLSDPTFTDAAYRQSHPDLRRLWRRLDESGRQVVDGYRAVITDPGADPEVTWEVARLVTDAGHPTEAVALNRFLVDHYRQGRDDVSARRLPAALVNLGAALFGQGQLEAAEPVLQEAINLSRARNDVTVLRAGLGDLALVRRDRGDLDGSLPLFAEDEALCRRLGDTIGLQASLGNRAQVLRQRGDFAGALALMGEQEALCRSIGDSTGVARALAAQGAILADTGRPAEAVERFTAFRVVSEELGDLRSVAEASISEADLLRQIGRRDEAASRAAEAETLIRRLGDEPLLSRILDARARAAVEEGRWADADQLAAEAVLTARSAGSRPALVLALGMRGTARRELGDAAGARAAHDEELSIATGLGDVGAIATAHVNLASVDLVANDLAAALAHYAQAEPILRTLGAQSSLALLYGNRWQVHSVLGNAPAMISDLIAGGHAAAACGALAQSQQMLTKAVENLYATGRMNETEPVWAGLVDVCRALGDPAGLQRALGERAMLVMARGDVATAAALFDEQESICRQHGDQVGLAACVGNRAILLRNTGDLPGALRCIDEQIEITRATNNGQGHLFATANRGEVLAAMGRVAEGLAALTEARTMAANWNLAPMVQQLDQMIAAVRAGQQ
ncbi:MAG: hypothetical protein JWM34_1852 [Ilumatobacteraceae bacterium]|nr:hypothetical protein [Ilumatobacteraceae bacterium]